MSSNVKTQGIIRETLCGGSYVTADSNTRLCVDLHENPKLVYLSFGTRVCPSQSASAEDLRELAGLFIRMADLLEV